MPKPRRPITPEQDAVASEIGLLMAKAVNANLPVTARRLHAAARCVGFEMAGELKVLERYERALAEASK